MKRRNAACISFLLLNLLQPMLPAQTASSVRDGVYTADQAQKGKDLYNDQCLMCHGAALEGTGQSSPLAGADFMNKWSDQTLSDLFDKIHSTMPANDPGSLTPEQTSQLISWILSSNKFPAGKTELSSDPNVLKTIHIEKPKQ